MQQRTVAIDGKRFYEHRRVDLRGIADSAFRASERRKDRVVVICVDVTVERAWSARRVTIRNLARDSRDQPEGERREPEQAEDEDEREETKLPDPPPAPVRGGLGLAAFAAKQALGFSSARRS